MRVALILAVGISMAGCEQRQEKERSGFVASEDSEPRPSYLKRWHARTDCPDLLNEARKKVYPPRKQDEREPGYQLRIMSEYTWQQTTPVPVTVRGNHQFTNQGFRYDLENCSKCAY